MEFENLRFEGWDAVCLSKGDAALVVTTATGQRIIHYGLTGGPNAFQVIPETRGQADGGDTWQPYGGHRLWHAPEVKPRLYHPDNGPYGTPAMDGDTLSKDEAKNPPPCFLVPRSQGSSLKGRTKSFRR